MENIKERNRLDFIDLAKGICILIIVLGHLGIDIPIVGLNYNTAMPMFFIVSGFFFKIKSSLIDFLKHKINTLLIPFLLFYIVSYLLYYLTDLFTPGIVKTSATGILDVFCQRQYFNGPIWFLLCLFWVNCLLGLLVYYFKNNNFIIAPFVIFITIIGYILYINEFMLPCVIDVSFTSLMFFYIGYLLKKTNILLGNKYDRYNWILIIFLYIIACFLDYVSNSAHIGFLNNKIYGNYILIILLAISSVLAVLLICKEVNSLPFLTYFGKYSIVPLCVHHLVYRPILVFTQCFGDYKIVVTAILTVLICWGLIPLFLNYFPYFIGKKGLIPVINK